MYIIRAVNLDTGEDKIVSEHECRAEALFEINRLRRVRYHGRKDNGQYPMPVHHIVVED